MWSNWWWDGYVLPLLTFSSIIWFALFPVARLAMLPVNISNVSKFNDSFLFLTLFDIPAPMVCWLEGTSMLGAGDRPSCDTTSHHGGCLLLPLPDIWTGGDEAVRGGCGSRRNHCSRRPHPRIHFPPPRRTSPRRANHLQKKPKGSVEKVAEKIIRRSGICW